MEATLDKLLRPYRLAFSAYPIYTFIALNYADFGLTAILILNRWDTEANPIVVATGGVLAPFNLVNKLIIIPLIAMFGLRPIYLRFRDRPRIGRFIRLIVNLVLVWYFIIVALGLGEVMYHLGVP